MEKNITNGIAIIVEDEEALLDFVELVLEDFNYHAEKFTSVEALRDNKKTQQFSEIDILLIDHNLPGEGGISFLKSLAPQDYPKLTIVTSGDLIDKKDLPEGLNFQILQKPYAPTDIEKLLK